MRKLFVLLVGFMSVAGLKATDTVYIKAPQVPVLIERHDNVLFYMRLDARESKVLDNVSVTFGKDVPLSQIKSVKLYYGGTEAFQDRGKNVLLLLIIFPVILRVKHCQLILRMLLKSLKLPQREIPCC